MTQPLLELIIGAIAIAGGGTIGAVLWHWLTGPRDRNPPASIPRKYR